MPDHSPVGIGSGPGPANKQNRRIALYLFLTMMATFALSNYVSIGLATKQKEISEAQLFDLIKTNKVETIVNEPDPSTGLRWLTGTYKKPINNAPNAPETDAAFKVPVDLAFSANLSNEIRAAGYTKVIETETNPNLVWPLFVNLLPIVLLMGLVLALSGFWIWMIVDCIQNESSESNDKIVWLLVIILTGSIGALIYFLVRRPQQIGPDATFPSP